MAETEPKLKSSASEEKKEAKSHNILEKAKEEIEAVFLHDKSHHHQHHKETHGRSDDIDEKTPSDEVKGPNVFERIKEEFEAVAGAIHPNKESSSHGSSSQK